LANPECPTDGHDGFPTVRLFQRRRDLLLREPTLLQRRPSCLERRMVADFSRRPWSSLVVQGQNRGYHGVFIGLSGDNSGRNPHEP
jgi:hypothetical protein